MLFLQKNPEFLNYISDKTIGIRIPDYKFTRKIQETGLPFLTTSVNFSGEKPANSVKEINQKILKKVDFIVDGGILSGKASSLIKEGKQVKR